MTDLSTHSALKASDVYLFQGYDRGAMQRVMQTPGAIGLGAALVASAAFAREYDAVSWLHQPLDLLGPFAASLLLCSVLYVFLRCCLASAGQKQIPASWRDYLVILSGYWMTAPLAWLYAFPIELWADEVASLRFNLAMLSIVSIWRVTLFSRFLSIRYSVSFWACLIWVLVPCMAIAFFALISQLMSMTTIMGGLRLTQTQQVLANYNSFVIAGIFYGFVPMLIALVVSVGMTKSRDREEATGLAIERNVGKSAWAVAVIALAVLLGLATLFQSQRYRAGEVDRLLIAERFADAIDSMRAHGPHAYPKIWDPPPHFPKRSGSRPDMMALVDALYQTGAETWIVDRFTVQAEEIVLRQQGWHFGSMPSNLRHQLPYEPIERIEALLVRFDRLRGLPTSDPVAKELWQELYDVSQQSLVEAKELAAANDDTVDSNERSDQNHQGTQGSDHDDSVQEAEI